MSGICGLVLQDTNYRLDNTQLFPLLHSLNTEEDEKGHSKIFGPGGIGVRSFPGFKAEIAELSVHGRSISAAIYGNIYNWRELVPTKERGARPLVGLLQIFLREGMTFLRRLRGEFALVIWDGAQETLYLATDRFRVHPLFYYYDEEKFVFASRIKALIACPFSLDMTIDFQAMVDTVASSIIPTPRTIFQEVKKLPAGHLLTFHKGKIRLESYWEISFLQVATESRAELANELKRRFSDSISVRLADDGSSDRVGTFLSGGVDSTTVTGVLTRLAGRSIRCFSIGFDEQGFNEINYARIAARAFGAEHHEYFVTPKDVCDTIPILVDTFDEPFANASAVPTYFCAKLAREHGVKILYAGDGGDELFAGNERYASQHLFDYFYWIPTWLREVLVKPLFLGLANRWRWEFFTKGRSYIQRASIPYPERLSSYGFFKVVPPTDFFENDLLEMLGRDYDPYGAINVHYYQAPARNELDRQLYIDLKISISDNDLFKVTRMTEAAGVSVRFPFLDHQLAEFAATVPANIKMQGRNLRSFFKKAYSDLLPRDIRTKKKHGFGLPIPVWLRSDRQLCEMMHDLVLSPQSIQRGYFRKKALEELIECHKTDQTSFYGTVLWNLMILELWHRRFFD